MVRAQNTDAIAEATARRWADWLSLLDDAGAGEQRHTGIAQIAEAHMPETLRNPGWWAQGVAVAYAQERGMRVPGQSADGTFKTSVSRTVSGSPEQARAAWQDMVGSREDHDGVAVEGAPRTSDTPKRLYWRVSLADGSAVSLSAEPAGQSAQEKTKLTLSHEKLVGPEVIDGWKTHWKALLQRLPA